MGSAEGRAIFAQKERGKGEVLAEQIFFFTKIECWVAGGGGGGNNLRVSGPISQTRNSKPATKGKIWEGTLRRGMGGVGRFTLSGLKPDVGSRGFQFRGRGGNHVFRGNFLASSALHNPQNSNKTKKVGGNKKY